MTAKVDRAQADVMAGRICAAAGLSAQSECELLELIGEFDAVEAIRWWVDLKSLAHWLSWSCSMSPGVAREHVRVAKAMRRMPTVTAAFREGRLSYSKVREVTRVVDVLDEGQLCAMALTATASQLARMLRAYRSTTGSRIHQERERALSWVERDDGMVDFRLRLPKEEAALVIAAVSAAKDQFGAPPPVSCPDLLEQASRHGSDDRVDTTPAYGNADAIVDVAKVFLDTAPEDRSGEDRTLVVVHVAAAQLAEGAAAGVPAGTRVDSPAARSRTELAAPGSKGVANVPAGTSGAGSVPAGTFLDEAVGALGDDPGSGLPDGTCHIQGLGGIEPATAARLACDADVLAAAVDAGGEVLALGRSRRLVSRGQRRALMIRDGMCQFPGCSRHRHLEAHHIVAWSAGGPTDLANLILLCRFHHTAVHEGGMRIVGATQPAAWRRWDFVMPDGRPHEPWYRAESLARLLAEQSGPRRERYEAVIEGVDGFTHPDARRILPGWCGEPFDIHECVQALYRMQITPVDIDDAGEDWEAA